MPDTIATLKRGERFTVHGIPELGELTFLERDGCSARCQDRDGQSVWIATWAIIKREGRDG